MTDEQDRIVKRFRRLVKDAHSVGLAVVSDGDSGVRFMPTEDLRLHDIRERGIKIEVDGTCGGGEIVTRGGGF